MEFKKYLVFVFVGIFMIGLVNGLSFSPGDVSKMTDEEKKIAIENNPKEFEIGLDGAYNEGKLILSSDKLDVWIDHYEFDKNGNKIYHIDSKRVMANRTLVFEYDFQPDYIKHINHKKERVRIYTPLDWEWRYNNITEDGRLVLHVEDIDYGLGSNTFPIGVDGSQWAFEGDSYGDFDGTASQLPIYTNVAFSAPFNSTSLSYCMWFNLNQNTAPDKTFMHINFGNDINDENIGMWALMKNSNRIDIGLGNGTSREYESLTVTPAWVIGDWHHFCASHSHPLVEFYIDGVNVQDRTYNIVNYINWSGTNHWRIGVTGSNAAFMPASLEEIRVYNRTMNSDEVLEIYNSGRISNSNLPSDGLVLWIDFDDGSIEDKSGMGYIGTNTNITIVTSSNNTRTLIEGLHYIIDKENGVFTPIEIGYNGSYYGLVWSIFEGTSLKSPENTFHDTYLFLMAGGGAAVSLMLIAGIIFMFYNGSVPFETFIRVMIIATIMFFIAGTILLI